ncbi:unnamed protein product, partial [Owenia fusiformis]
SSATMILQYLILVIGLISHYAWSRGDVSGDRDLTKEEMQYFLDLHNEYRAKTARGETPNQPKAANMVAMEWDDRLEKSAQGRADTCLKGHDTNEERMFKPYPFVGQNYAGNYGIRQSFDAWYNEYKDYSYSGPSCNAVCGHYTALVWATTSLVGCGYNDCGDGWDIMHCNYAPGGNTANAETGIEDKPYIEGEPCSQCPVGYSFCMDNVLCASKRACSAGGGDCKCTLTGCKNGKFNKKECSCTCDDGWSGAGCDVECKDGIDYCSGFVDQGQCEWDAMMWMWMADVCRKSCKKCDPADDPNKVNSVNIAVHTTVKGAKGGDGDKANNSDNMQGDQPKVAGNNDKPASGGGNCVNSFDESKCSTWAANGECSANPDWMQANCAKACGQC